MTPSLSLVGAVLGLPRLPSQLQALVAGVLVQLNTQLPRGDDDTSSYSSPDSATSTGGEDCRSDGGVPDSSTDKMRTMLFTINEQFIRKIDPSSVGDQDLFVIECLKNIGLYNVVLRPIVVDLLKNMKSSLHLSISCEANSALRWIENSALSIKVFSDQRKIINSMDKIDWSMPFLEDYIIKSLENGAEPYVPFSVAVMNHSNSNEIHNRINPEISSSRQVPAVSSCFSTPRSDYVSGSYACTSQDVTCSINSYAYLDSSNISRDIVSLNSFVPKLNLPESSSSLLGSSLGRASLAASASTNTATPRSSIPTHTTDVREDKHNSNTASIISR